MAVHVDPEDLDLPGGLHDQGADDADGGGLAGPVGAQQREEVALGHAQIDALESLEAPCIDLFQAGDGQCGCRHRVHPAETEGAGGPAPEGGVL
jgi:hypothetical protein